MFGKQTRQLAMRCCSDISCVSSLTSQAISIEEKLQPIRTTVYKQGQYIGVLFFPEINWSMSRLRSGHIICRYNKNQAYVILTSTCVICIRM